MELGEPTHSLVWEVPPFGFHSGFLGLRPLDVCRGFNVFIARTFMEDAVNGMISRFSIVVAA